jgi:hypothetical protein
VHPAEGRASDHLHGSRLAPSMCSAACVKSHVNDYFATTRVPHAHAGGQRRPSLQRGHPARRLRMRARRGYSPDQGEISRAGVTLARPCSTLSACLSPPWWTPFAHAGPCSERSRCSGINSRHQLTVLQRSVARPRVTRSDRIAFVALAALTPTWKNVLRIVHPTRDAPSLAPRRIQGSLAVAEPNADRVALGAGDRRADPVHGFGE